MSLLQMTFDDCIAAGTRISAWHIATHHLDFVSNPNSGGGTIHAFEIMDLHPPFVAGVIDAGLGRPKKSLLDLDAADAYERGYEYIDAAAVVRHRRPVCDTRDSSCAKRCGPGGSRSTRSPSMVYGMGNC